LESWRDHQSKIKLLLTDLVMPGGVSGRELAQQLCQQQPALRVIYSSGYSADTMGKEWRLREGINFLQKPYPPRRLAQCVRECLDGGRFE
jgi:DNA-binding NtrC family response regulator